MIESHSCVRNHCLARPLHFIPIMTSGANSFDKISNRKQYLSYEWSLAEVEMMNQKRQSDLPAYFTRDLLAAIRYVKLEKGEHLFRTGDRVNGIYFILGGEVKAIRPMHNESDAVMMRAGVGEFFAESAIAASH